MGEPAVQQDSIAIDEKITCQECGASVNVIVTHIRKEHPDIALQIAQDNGLGITDLSELDADDKRADKNKLFTLIEDWYRETHPNAPLLSHAAQEQMNAKRKKLEEKKAAQAQVAVASDSDDIELRPLHQVFGMRQSRFTQDADKKPIMVRCFKKGHQFEELVPPVDPDYVWDLKLLKLIIMAVENKIPVYLWGYAGVGKSTGFIQYCARTNYPLVRVQHTGDTESAHIIGQTLANEQGTYFNPGPLALAMKHGWFYLADEYDFAFPQVSAVYQPVLENNALYIKEADDDWRLTKPHPNFFMAGTGNTNGAGDESGLFQGTNIQNAANYERFGIVEQVEYMEPVKEVRLLCDKYGLDKKHVEPVVDFVNRIREAFKSGKITNTAGQRVSSYIVKNYILTGNYNYATKLAFTNRLPEACRLTVESIQQRVFGD